MNNEKSNEKIEYVYICNKCDIIFKNNKEYSKHIKKCKIIKKNNNSSCLCEKDNNCSQNCYVSKNTISGKIGDIDDIDYIGISSYCDIYYCEYCNEEFENKILCVEHEKYCKNTKKKNKSCLRCGRTGHFLPDCCEINNINGDKIRD